MLMRVAAAELIPARDDELAVGLEILQGAWLFRRKRRAPPVAACRTRCLRRRNVGGLADRIRRSSPAAAIGAMLVVTLLPESDLVP
jgi:hypothetical protein